MDYDLTNEPIARVERVAELQGFPHYEIFLNDRGGFLIEIFHAGRLLLHVVVDRGEIEALIMQLSMALREHQELTR